jgi:predicted peptidase
LTDLPADPFSPFYAVGDPMHLPLSPRRGMRLAHVPTLFLIVVIAGWITTESSAQDQPKGVAVKSEAKAADVWKSSYTEQTFTDGSGVKHAYRLRFPDGFKEGDKTRYPLVVFLHGAGERGSDNEIQLVHGAIEFARADRQAKYPCFVLFPQVPLNEKWADADWGKPTGTGNVSDKDTPSMAAVLGMIDQWVKSGSVDPDRIYLTGLSMGGYGTWYAGAIHRERWAAIAPICGGGDPTWAKRYAGLPIWNFHGTADKAVPISRSREMIEALAAAGQKPEPKNTEYEGVGHDSWTQTYRRDDFFEWLFAQRKAAP